MAFIDLFKNTQNGEVEEELLEKIMKNLTTLLLTLLVLGGCTSEWDECVEENKYHNYSTLNPTFSMDLITIQPSPGIHACITKDPLVLEYNHLLSDATDEYMHAIVNGVLTDEIEKEMEVNTKLLEDKYYSDVKVIWKRCERYAAEAVCYSEGFRRTE